MYIHMNKVKRMLFECDSFAEHILSYVACFVLVCFFPDKFPAPPSWNDHMTNGFTLEWTFFLAKLVRPVSCSGCVRLFVCSLRHCNANLNFNLTESLLHSCSSQCALCGSAYVILTYFPCFLNSYWFIYLFIWQNTTVEDGVMLLAQVNHACTAHWQHLSWPPAFCFADWPQAPPQLNDWLRCKEETDWDRQVYSTLFYFKTYATQSTC